MSIFDLPPVSLSAADDERVRRETEQSIMQEGGAAFRFGLPIEKCPPFNHPGHAWAWRQGWRNERDARAAK